MRKKSVKKKFGIICAPTSQGSMKRAAGSEFAPEKIISFLNSDIFRKKKIKKEQIIPEKNNLEETNKKIFEKIKKAKMNFFLLGGDHSITYSSLKAFSEVNKGVGLIVFDAHPDLVNRFNPPSHEDYLRTLIEEKIIPAEKIIIIGARKINKVEGDFIKKNNIRNYSPKEILERGLKEVSCEICKKAENWGSVYLSIDIDAIDPLYAPATGCPKLNGLNKKDFFFILKKIICLNNLKGGDLVEVIPSKDIKDKTLKISAKIVKLFI